MQPIQTDKEYYNRTLRLHDQRKSGMVELEWARKVFPTAVLSRFPWKGESFADRNFRSLGIGSGTGEIELELLRHLSSRFPRIDHVVVEPSHESITQYKKTLAASITDSTTDSMTGVDVEWREETIQEFQRYSEANSPGQTCQRKFDFITTMHSLYYADDADTAVEFLYRSLAPGGVMLITLDNDRTLPTDVLAVLWEGEKNLWVTCDDVKRALTRLNIEFTCRTHILSQDITCLFDATSQEGNMLLDFLTHVKNFRATADPQLVQRVLDFFKEWSRDYAVKQKEDGCAKNDGEAIAPNSDDHHVVIDKTIAYLIVSKSSPPCV